MTAADVHDAARRSTVVRSGQRAGALVGQVVLRVAVLLAVIAVWQVLTARAGSAFFPTPMEIVGRTYDNWFSGPLRRSFLTDAAFQDIAPSLGRLLAGWSLAAAVGIVVGVVIGSLRSLADYLDPIIHFVRAIPPPALIPLFLVLFGLGTDMKVALIAFGVVWPILLNTIDGVRSADRLQLATARAFGVSRWKRLTRVVLPSASPRIFAGLRVSSSIAVILMVISEMVAARDGIGFRILQAQRSFQVLDVWAGILLLGIIGYLLNSGLVAVERRALRWHRGARQRDVG